MENNGVAVQESAPEAAKARLRPSQCRVYLRRELAKSFQGIVSGFVKQAESGSVPHMKETMLLLDEPAAPKRKRPAQQLRDALERMDGESGAGGLVLPEPTSVWRD